MKRMRFVGELEARDWLALNKWKELKIDYYSEDDIKQELLKSVNTNTDYCYHDWIDDIIRHAKKRSGATKCFCKVDGIWYFTESGYRKIIEHLKRCEIIRPERKNAC